MDLDEERKAMAEVAARTGAKYPELSEAKVKSVVDASYHELDDAPILNFVGILVEKQAMERLSG